MAVAEGARIAPAGSAGASGSAGAPADYDRTPPQDVEAERSVLGAMMMSKDAIADVVEVIRPGDFYYPANQLIYDSIIDLYTRGDPADAITVSSELTRSGQLLRVGGGSYLHTLISTVPTAANAGYYAQIVAERAILRRLVTAGTRIVQMGYDTASGSVGVLGSVDDVVDRAQSEVYEVTERRTSEDYARIEDLLQGTWDELEHIMDRGGVGSGVPTSFARLDEITNGLHPGQMITVAGRPGSGKALALDTALVTPTGWTTMGAVNVGDLLVGADGRPTRVVAATDVMLGRPCYEVEFSDGTVITADAEHQWRTTCPVESMVVVGSGAAGSAEASAVTLVSTTEQIRQTLRGADGLPNHRIVQLGKPIRYVVDIRTVESVPVRCVQVDNDDHMYLAGRGKVPTHNSTLALDFARSAAVRYNKPTVIFSLEMGRLEIMMRLLSAEASVPLASMRSGHMTDQDWQRMARRSGELAEAPLFIDDSANLTMMEIRAKSRRLKQRHDLQLIIIDYLQLMTSGKRVESRQTEVSEFSRSIKLLAKELDVPVVALSQLNRGPEQRTDKKPMLSDLRESGCLTASTRIWRADTGAEVTIGALVESGERDVPVWSFDDHLRLIPATMTHAFSTGVKEVFRLTLTSGRTIEATANHPFLQLNQWTPLGELTVGDRVAIPRSMPEPLAPVERPNHETILLAHLLGGGSFVEGQAIRYASADAANLAVVGAAAEVFGATVARDEDTIARISTLRLTKSAAIKSWLQGLGLDGLRSHQKFVPADVFSMPKRKVALFLHHLWATDGCVHDPGSGQARIYYASTSRQLADDVARLLTRFGITARIKATRKADYRPCYQVHIYGADQQKIFLHDINSYGPRGVVGDRAFGRLKTVTVNTNVDTVPREVWNNVRVALADSPMTHQQFSAAIDTKFCGSARWKAAPGRNRLARVAKVLEQADLEILATNDVHWDTVASIESLGEVEVYDATVIGTHNFIADGIAVHNSIEQDSDMVVLVHREDMYEPESPRAGEADLILAKHRNGPTGVVAVAFQGRYSRFTDMPQ